MRKKIGVVGAGMVGGTLTQRLAERNYADLVLADIAAHTAEGKALDIAESAPLLGFDSVITAAGSFAALAGAEIVVVTSGLARKPGMTREDLLFTNASIVREVVRVVAAAAPQATLVMVSNPVAPMTAIALAESGFPRERVIGMAGTLDAARYATFLAEEIGVAPRDVHPCVLGGHGDLFVPVPRLTTVMGASVTELLAPERLEAIAERTRHAGQEIVDLLKTGSAYYAPAAAIAELVDAIARDQGRVLPCTVRLDGEYGLADTFLDIPVVLGAGGMRRTFPLSLTDAERAQLARAAATVNGLVHSLSTLA